MAKTVKDVFGLATFVVAAAVFIGLHSWMYIQ